jgi:hypothetical protein
MFLLHTRLRHYHYTTSTDTNTEIFRLQVFFLLFFYDVKKNTCEHSYIGVAEEAVSQPSLPHSRLPLPPVLLPAPPPRPPRLSFQSRLLASYKIYFLF